MINFFLQDSSVSLNCSTLNFGPQWVVLSLHKTKDCPQNLGEKTRNKFSRQFNSVKSQNWKTWPEKGKSGNHG